MTGWVIVPGAHHTPPEDEERGYLETSSILKIFATESDAIEAACAYHHGPQSNKGQQDQWHLLAEKGFRTYEVKGT